jgi:hypothetical protein
LAEEHEGDVVFVGVSNNDTTEDGKGFVEKFDVPYAMGHSPEVWELYGVRYQPVTVVIAADGSLAERIVGPVTYEQLRDVISEVL